MTTNDKYKMTKEGGLFRIEALKDFGRVSKGDKGGLISREDNLSVSGDAWVYGNASVSGDARVYGNARVSKSKHTGKVVVMCLSRDNLTVDGKYIHIGCRCYTIKQWLKNYKKVGKCEGYTGRQIREYGCALKMIREAYSNDK